ncbi:MAG: FlgD immunoglobulin-like domain containing protein [Candidatus Eisenbacteria bacterium]
MPTAAGNGVSDVWPFSWLEVDYQAHAAESSPLTISLIENGVGDFTAHIEAEQAVTDARFCMVATLDEYVAAYGGGQSHLPYHAVAYMTSTSGDALTLGAGEKVDIQKAFALDPSWDYAKMGVACWVQQAGGTNPSPQPYGDLSIKNKVLQAAFLGAMSADVPEFDDVSGLSLLPPSPNPFSAGTRLSFVLPSPSHASLELFDVAGRRVAVLADRVMGGGEHEVVWNGRDTDGNDCAPGIYFARLVAERGGTARARVVKVR